MSVLAPKQKQAKTNVKKKEQDKNKPVKGKREEVQKQNALGNRFMEQEAKQKSNNEKKDAVKEVAVAQTVTVPSNKIEKVLDTPMVLEGNSTEAIEQFSEASASGIANVYPTLGSVLSEKLNEEQKKENENAPVLVVSSDLGQREEKEKADRPLVDKAIEKSETLNEEEPLLLQAEPHIEISSPPQNAAARATLMQKPKDGFLSWFKNSFMDFLIQIKTTDVHLNTSAGNVPSLQMKGKANVSRMAESKAASQGKVVHEKNVLNQKILSHKGKSKIKAANIDEKKPVTLSTEVKGNIKTSSDTGMQEYLAIELSTEIRKHADDLLKPTLQKSTEKLKESTGKAKKEKESSREKEIIQSKKEVQRLNLKTSKEQAAQLSQSRKDLALEQQKGMDEAHKSVESFNKESGEKEKTSREDIKTAVKKANSDAKEAIVKGENKASTIKEKKEVEAEKKKKELAQKKKNRSFWDKTVDVVKSVVKVLTDAIDNIFTAMRTLVKKVIEKAKNLAVSLIDKVRKWVIKKLEAFSKVLKSMVNRYLKTYFPKIAKMLNKAIDAVVKLSIKTINFIADSAIKAVKALANALGKVLDKILSIYQTALKAAVSIVGAVLTGDFAGALKIAIQAACDIAGVDSKPIFDFFARAGKQLLKILKSPVVFFKNLVRAVGNGIKRFQKNIKKHLKAALIGWLTGALSDVEIEMPKKFDFKGVLSLVMQVLGLTYKNIKARIIKKYPASEKVFDKVEKGFTLIKEVLAGGVIVLWKKVKEKIGDLKEMVLSGIRNFVIFSVIKNGILWLLSLLNPAAAIAKAMKLIYDLTMFLVDRFTQIKDFVLSVYHSIVAIASGSFGKASKSVEGAMAKSLPVIISMLATAIGLGGIGKRVQNIIKKISNPVNKVIDKVVERAVNFAKKIVAKFKGKKKQKGKTEKEHEKNKSGKLSIDKTLGEKLTFSAGKENHKLWITNVAGKIKVMVASDVLPVEDQLVLWGSLLSTLPVKKQPKVKGTLFKARNLNNQVMVEAFQEDVLTKIAFKDKVLTEKEVKAEQKAEDETIEKEKQLEQLLKVLFDTFGDIDTGKIFDSVLRNRAIYQISEITTSEKYKVFLEEYKTKHTKSFIDNHIGIIRQKIQPLIGAYLRKGDVSIFDSTLKTYLEESMTKSKGTKLHTKYKPQVRSIAIDKSQFIVTYSYDPKGDDKQKEFKVVFDFSQVSDTKKGTVTQRTEGTNLKLKEKGIRGATEGSGQLFDQSRLYRLFLEEKNKKIEKKATEVKLKEMVSDIGMDLFIAYARKKVNYNGNTDLEERAKKLQKANLFDSAHIVADWFGGSGYRQALNLSVTSAEYNRIVMGDAEKYLAESVKKKGEETTFNLNVAATWDYLEDNEILKVVNEKSIVQRLKTEIKDKEVDQRILSLDAKKELDSVLQKKQDPRRVLNVDYSGHMLVENKDALKKEIGCDIWMSSYFDFDKNSDDICKH